MLVQIKMCQTMQVQKMKQITPSFANENDYAKLERMSKKITSGKNEPQQLKSRG